MDDPLTSTDTVLVTAHNTAPHCLDRTHRPACPFTGLQSLTHLADMTALRSASGLSEVTFFRTYRPLQRIGYTGGTACCSLLPPVKQLVQSVALCCSLHQAIGGPRSTKQNCAIINRAMQFMQTIRLFSMTDKDCSPHTSALCGNREHDTECAVT
jgi:hypothetical protein